MSISSFSRVVIKRWRLVSAAVLFAIVTALLLTLSTRDEFEASVSMYVSTQSGSDNAGLAYQGGLLSQERVKTYSQLIGSTRVSQAVVNELQLRQTAQELASKVTVDTEPDSVLMVVSVQDQSPALAANIADKVADIFPRIVAELEQPANPNLPPPVTIKVVQRAELPSEPISPRPLLNLGLGTLLGLLVGVALAVGRERSDTSVQNLSQVDSDAVLLGAIPVDRALTENRMVVAHRPRSQTSEAFRGVRTNLQFVNVDQEKKCLAVTSSVAGEGKSTFICNLALALADSGVRVAVVDADMRRPKVAEYTGLSGTVGLSSVLAGVIPARQATQRWRANIDVLASGKNPPNPSEILGSAQMGRLIAELKDQYDIVLIDTPPVLAVTDPVVVGRLCDGVVVIVHHRATTKAQLSRTLEALTSVSVLVLGCVFSMVAAGRREDYLYSSQSYYAESAARTDESDESADTTAVSRQELRYARNETQSRG